LRLSEFFRPINLSSFCLLSCILSVYKTDQPNRIKNYSWYFISTKAPKLYEVKPTEKPRIKANENIKSSYYYFLQFLKNLLSNLKSNHTVMTNKIKLSIDESNTIGLFTSINRA